MVYLVVPVRGGFDNRPKLLLTFPVDGRTDRRADERAVGRADLGRRVEAARASTITNYTLNWGDRVG